MSTKRRRFSSTEKAKIALEAIKGEHTIAEIINKYKVHSTQVNSWKKQALEHLPESFTNKDKQVKTDYETQLAELYQQIGRLKVENDFLKKKSELFDS